MAEQIFSIFAEIKDFSALVYEINQRLEIIQRLFNDFRGVDGAIVDLSGIDITSLSGYDANENIDHTAVSIIAGTGLAGGGTIAENRTFTASTILQKYHAIDPAANVQSLLGADDYAAMMVLLSAKAGAEFSFNSQKVGGVADPTTDQQAATKKYVDGVTLPATQVEVSEIGTATYDDLQDLINNTVSAGYVSGGLITATSPADGTIAISAIKGYLKSTDNELGITQSFDLDGTTAFELTNNDTNYIYVDFVSGPRFQVTTTRADIESNRQFTIGRVYRVDNVTHIVQSGIQLPNFVRISHERLKETRGFEQASGGAISETGERYIVSTGGVFYLGNNKIETTGVNTSGAPTFTRHYHVAGNWSSDTQSQICAAAYQYDNGTALANLSNNKFGVFWVFIHFDSDLHVVVGRGNYTLAEAQAAILPALPNIVSDFGALAAKIIIEEDATNFLTVQGAYERFFPISGAFEHNDLGALQGGTTDQYQHLNTAEHTVAIQAATDALNGYMSLAYAAKLDGIAENADVTGSNVPKAHNLIDTTGHPVSGLTTGHFLKATGETTYAFGAHGLGYNDVGAEQSGVSVLESDYGADTFMYATANNTPVATSPANVMAALSGHAGAEFLFNTQKIGGVVDPTANQQVATKKYVDDNSGSGLAIAEILTWSTL